MSQVATKDAVGTSTHGGTIDDRASEPLLKPDSIDSRDQLEQECLDRFYSTRCTTSMIELTHTRQDEDEPVVDHTDRWRNLQCFLSLQKN